MTYPTIQQIDDAIPTDGRSPSREKTNALLKQFLELPTVRNSGGVVAGARMWVGTTTANSSGIWTIDYSDAGFTEVFGVFPSAVSKGTALADRLIAVNDDVAPTTTTAGGHLMSSSGAGLLVAVTLAESAGTVKVLVVGR